MVEDWPRLESERLGDYRIFSLRRDLRRSPRTGREHGFYVLEADDWVNVIPVTPAGNVVLIHQFRHGRSQVCLEIPGGIVDPGEDPAASAERELLEETGYTAVSFHPIGRVTPNPAFLDNLCHTYLALGAQQIETPAFEGAEDIATELAPLARIPEMIGNGRITHALVIAAFYHLETYRRRHPHLIPE